MKVGDRIEITVAEEPYFFVGDKATLTSKAAGGWWATFDNRNWAQAPCQGSASDHVFSLSKAKFKLLQESAMQRYEIEFMIHSIGGVYTTHIKYLSDATEGFWVNDDGEHTVGGDCKYFILPHMIRRVEKITEH